MQVTKRIDLVLLGQQLAAAGITVNGLGMSGEAPGQPGVQDLYTYRDGQPVELPPDASAVVDAHIAPAPPAPANYGGDASNLDTQAAAVVTALRAFIANPTPTNAEVVSAVKLNARAILALIRKQGL